MHPFEIGDRVVAIAPVDGRDMLRGCSGTVVDISDGRPPIGVEFDEQFPFGHDCHGHGKLGKCYYGYSNEFEYEETETVIDPEETSMLDAFLSSYQK